MKILVVAGEASADLHAGHVVEELQAKTCVELIGVGGDRLSVLGLKPLKTPREMAVVGLAEALKKIPQSLRLLKDLESLAARERPDFALLLDLPDFNLRLAPKLKALGIPVVYYISPQVWAWRKGRVIQMAECIDLLLCILPFEKEWYEKNAPKKLRVEYVGHPVIKEVPVFAYVPQKEKIALLPGSRESEIQSLLPDLLRAAVLMKKQNPHLQFHLPLAEPLRKSMIARELLSLKGPLSAELNALGANFHVEEISAHEILRSSKLALIASGTATLEAAVVGTPMIVVYRVSATTAFLFRYLVRYQGPIAMVNLVHKGLGSNERVVPELLQDDASPEKLAETALHVLAHEYEWATQANTLATTRTLLSGNGDPVHNVVERLLEFHRASAT